MLLLLLLTSPVVAVDFCCTPHGSGELTIIFFQEPRIQVVEGIKKAQGILLAEVPWPQPSSNAGPLLPEYYGRLECPVMCADAEASKVCAKYAPATGMKRRNPSLNAQANSATPMQ